VKALAARSEANAKELERAKEEFEYEKRQFEEVKRQEVRKAKEETRNLRDQLVAKQEDLEGAMDRASRHDADIKSVKLEVGRLEKERQRLTELVQELGGQAAASEIAQRRVKGLESELEEMKLMLRETEERGRSTVEQMMGLLSEREDAANTLQLRGCGDTHVKKAQGLIRQGLSSMIKWYVTVFNAMIWKLLPC